MKKKIALILATGSLLAGGAALAQPADRGERGPMTRDAVAERTAERFAKMDANGDGVINPADREAKMKERFAKMDTNNDGVLSETEFTTAHQQMRENRKERREARAERRGGQQMRRGGRGGRGGGQGAMLKRADANQDGQVTQAEFQTAALARFDRVDANGDGTITRDERRAARQAMRGQRRGQ
ncbi:EF-hand domain-containing protein [Parerythrobacter jejuensis]|uniref:EF-hand domain-containing protein n=1 Tax=Parerythrobacter jejuensis TaxID=795812 RepID=A0A845ALL9_9SPHN|nr:EF-hand domain-containing protein [Parerythrobacter jejuensis]MXP31160.1 hypothetical protein [Parerythrobacter jejuensis]MXP33920.1 hypothetical protein [Parerythrobacter jejuensis]